MVTATVEDLKSQLLKLPAADREQLAIFLWDSVGDDEGEYEEISDDELVAELDRRWQDIVSGKAVGVPAAEVFAKLKAKYG